jgi:hypothetical protein
MRFIQGWLVAAAVAASALGGSALAQDSQAAAVRAAADKFSGNFMWRPATLLAADFNCTGKVQHAMLGTSVNEIAVAIFADGLDRPPALVRFEGDAQSIAESKIRLDDYTLSPAEIADITGTPPVGYRPSAACHGVRLSDDRSEAAHIYWDHDNQRFDSWVQ